MCVRGRHAPHRGREGGITTTAITIIIVSSSSTPSEHVPSGLRRHRPCLLLVAVLTYRLPYLPMCPPGRVCGWLCQVLWRRVQSQLRQAGELLEQGREDEDVELRALHWAFE